MNTILTQRIKESKTENIDDKLEKEKERKKKNTYTDNNIYLNTENQNNRELFNYSLKTKINIEDNKTEFQDSKIILENVLKKVNKKGDDNHTKEKNSIPESQKNEKSNSELQNSELDTKKNKIGESGINIKKYKNNVNFPDHQNNLNKIIDNEFEKKFQEIKNQNDIPSVKEKFINKEQGEFSGDILKKTQTDLEKLSDLKNVKDDQKNIKTNYAKQNQTIDINKNHLPEFISDSLKIQISRENDMELNKFRGRIQPSKNAGEFLNFFKDKVNKSSSNMQKHSNSSFSQQFAQSDNLSNNRILSNKTANKGQSLSKYAKQNINLLIQRAKIVIGKGQTGSVSIHLNPQILGQVHLKVYLKDNKLSARIMVETSDAKKMFHHHMNELWKQFQEAGFDLDDFTIDYYQNNKNGSKNRNILLNQENQNEIINKENEETSEVFDQTISDESSQVYSANKINIRV
jgi:hypothetical protein